MAFSDVHSFIDWRLISRRYCLSPPPFLSPAILYSIRMNFDERRDVLKFPDLKPSYRFKHDKCYKQIGEGLRFAGLSTSLWFLVRS